MDPEKLWIVKRRAAVLSLAANVGLTLLKVLAAIFTTSISLLSEAVHSATDIVASVIALASVKAAAVPPDDEHPFGHGKIESLAGFGESILLFGIVVYILAEAIPRFLRPTEVRFPLAGIAVMTLSAGVCLAVGRYVFSVGQKTESLALQSNGQHLRIDAITSLGVLAALLLTKYGGFRLADPTLACVIAIWIAYNAQRTFLQAFNQLIDHRITDEEMRLILEIVDGEREILSYHRLLTRHSGSHHFVELHVVVPREYSVVQAHEVADRLEKAIERSLPPAHVVVHVDPLEPSKIH